MSSARDAYPPTLKRYGQHFLTDDHVLDQIVSALEITPSDTVLEIGPGRGALTERLVERAGRVVAVELDRALAQLLTTRYAARPNVTILEQDVLTLAFGDVVGDDYLLVGNVPYYITTPILFHALSAPMPRRAVYLVQREVAERAVSPAGGKIYGALSVNLQSVAHVEQLFTVPASAFRPPPKVESAVIRITPLPMTLVDGSERRPFQTFVQSLFSQRRKQLTRIMRTLLAASSEDIDSMLQSLEIDPHARPETLTPEDFARLFRTVRQRER